MTRRDVIETLLLLPVAGLFLVGFVAGWWLFVAATLP